jgi:membrane protein required for colicin V production
MNFFDIILIIILSIFILKGLFRGIIIEGMTLAGLVVAYIIALREMSSVASLISKNVNLPSLFSSPLGFILIFLTVFIFFRVIAEFLRRFIRKTPIVWIDRSGGMLFGLVKGAFIASLLTIVISFVPLKKSMQIEKQNSVLFEPIRSVAPKVFDLIKKGFPNAKTFSEEVNESLAVKSQKIVSDLIKKQIDSIQKELKGRFFNESKEYTKFE